jgi:hypothetical protein
MDRFFGYGDWSAPVWFVGMEEGGGATIGEVQRRIETWSVRGRCALEDLVEYHYAIGLTKHVGPHPQLQPTWSKIVHLLLGMRRQSATPDDVRRVQATQIGRRGGSSCLIELLPLPSPGVNRWIYEAASTIPFLATREGYLNHLVRPRMAAIRELLERYRPRAVVFLGLSYAPYWSAIAGVSMEPPAGADFVMQTVLRTTFVCVKHPAARGVANTLFRNVGERLSARLADDDGPA